jgi:hypothetical protein
MGSEDGWRAANLRPTCICLAFMSFSSEPKGSFTYQNLLWHGTSIFKVISKVSVILTNNCRELGEGAITTYLKVLRLTPLPAWKEKNDKEKAIYMYMYCVFYINCILIHFSIHQSGTDRYNIIYILCVHTEKPPHHCSTVPNNVMTTNPSAVHHVTNRCTSFHKMPMILLLSVVLPYLLIC